MRLHVSLSFCVLVASSVLLNAGGTKSQSFGTLTSGLAQTSILKGSNDSSEYFNFQPQELVEFLWSSLKPQYQAEVEKMLQTLQNVGNASELIVKTAEMSALVSNLTNASQNGYNNSTEYYKTLFFPKYSQQCSWDMENITYALANIGKPETAWALQLVDAWGKLPAGLTLGRLTWPGDMNLCETVKGDSIDGTTGKVLNKGGIKGAWSMSVINLPVAVLSMIGAPPLMTANEATRPKLNWGMCLPASCGDEDLMKFTKKVEALDAKVSYVKTRASYPALNGDYKKDSKFLGVSAFFVLLILVVIVSTTIDWAVLRKPLEQPNKKAADEKIAMQTLASDPNDNSSVVNGTVMYNGAEKAYYATGGDVESSNTNGSVMYHGADKVAYTNGGFSHPEKMNGTTAYDGAEKVNNAENNRRDFEAPTSELSVKQDTPKTIKEPGVRVRLVKAFSLYENLPRLMDSTPKPNQLQALDGIRFLSMTWVILGHTLGTILGPEGIAQNIVTAFNFASEGDWTFMAIPAGTYAVDSFFLLSALLVGYLFLKMMDKSKGRMTCRKFSLTMLLYYVHRYIRLLPVLGGVILISIAYTNYFGTGPMNTWHSEANKNPCDSNWWTNLLYINNVYKDKQMCVGWTWYLANDMQFYWISPLLLIPLHRFPKFGLALISAALTAHLGVTGWKWSTGNGGSQFSDFGIVNSLYIKPYYRIGAYLVGLFLANILYKKIRVRSRIVQAAWWIISFGIMAACVYTPYDATKEGGIMTSSWDATQRAVFETLSRTLWAVALGWIIFASNTGCGGVIGDALSWSGWAPLSRLTYAAYMIHPILMTIVFRNRHSLIYIDRFNIVFNNMGFLLISYLVAGVLHLLLEAPMAELERLILPRNR